MGKVSLFKGMKKPNSVMKIMESGGSLNLEGCKEAQHRWKDGDELQTKKFVCHSSSIFHNAISSLTAIIFGMHSQALKTHGGLTIDQQACLLG